MSNALGFVHYVLQRSRMYHGSGGPALPTHESWPLCIEYKSHNYTVNQIVQISEVRSAAYAYDKAILAQDG